MLRLTDGDEGYTRIVHFGELAVSLIQFVSKDAPGGCGGLTPDGIGDGCRLRIVYLGGGRCEGIGYAFVLIDDYTENLEAVSTVRT